MHSIKHFFHIFTDLNVKNCDVALTSLMRHLSRDKTSQNVLKISLKNSTQFSDRGLELICQSCPNLRHFEVKNCKNVTNFGVQNLLQKCKSLSHLDLAGKSNFCFFHNISAQRAIEFNNLNKNSQEVSPFPLLSGNRRFRISIKSIPRQSCLKLPANLYLPICPNGHIGWGRLASNS